MESKQKLALITQVTYGYTDNGVGMVFSLLLLRGVTVLFMEASAVTTLLTESKVADINSLRGKPCAVNVTEDNIVSFDRLL